MLMRLEGPPGRGLVLDFLSVVAFGAEVFEDPEAEGCGGGICTLGELGLGFNLYRGEEVDPGFDRI